MLLSFAYLAFSTLCGCSCAGASGDREVGGLRHFGPTPTLAGVFGRVKVAAAVAATAACALAKAATSPSLPAPDYRTVAVAAGGKVWTEPGGDPASQAP